ncbi:hypothetical protein FRC17_005563, partial [Serendipita sp. 399]
GQNSLSGKSRGLVEANIMTLIEPSDGNQNAHVFPRKYLHSENWDGLFRTLTKASIHDPLVQLIVNKGSISPLEGVNQMLLDEVFSGMENSLLIRMPPRPRVEVHTNHLVSKESEVQNPVEPIPSAQLPPQVDEKVDRVVEDEQVSFNQEDHDAARTIQKAYRKYKQRSARTTSLDRWFNQYNKLPPSATTNRRYLAMLRGPLPHFMVCLEAYREHLDQQRRALSDQAQQGNHEMLEETFARLKKIDVPKKTATHIFNRVRPSSTIFHRLSVIPTLRADLITMSHDLEQFCKDKHSLSFHLELAQKGIVQVAIKKAVTTMPKPSLNTSDLLEL